MSGSAGNPIFDVAVIGAGIGGYVAAIRAAQLQRSVALIEREKVGGTCLNWGCIPTKTMLSIINLFETAKNFGDLGLRMEGIDLGKAAERKDAVVNRLSSGVHYLIKKNSIKLIEGKGTIKSRDTIQVSTSNGKEETIRAKNIVIATGSNDARPPEFRVDEKSVLTSRSALSIRECPESLAVIGGSIIGIEMAVIFNGLGSKVKIIESAASILPSFDREIGAAYQRILRRKGIDVVTGSKVAAVTIRPDSGVRLMVTSNGSSTEVEVEKALISMGRRPSTENLGLENVGLQMREGFILVDRHMRTNVPNIYAVGDVTGGKMLAHAALAGGVVAAENIAGLNSVFDPKIMPSCVYCKPEIASVGLSEEEAKSQGYDVAVGRFPMLANGRALSLGESEGFAKIVCDRKTGEILGVHLIGPNVTEVIGEASLAIKLECTVEELGSLIHAHPTVSETLMEAARAAVNKAIHA
ncbi:MAG: dihydrolipoyl dehydrogenase [Nitrososphaerota archaeon]|nr:dihydrolipoyl dehydrogenase [Candidatus Bathyarchaeota archaeon]MDW8048963.1 dihydrolipoyl dehydrogenase [Nitrososphaerota archaeon]